MHNYLIKIMILFGALAVISANVGVSSNIIHAATLSASRNMAAIPDNSSITPFVNTTYPVSSQPTGVFHGSQGLPTKELSLTQPLGNLVTITWSKLDMAENNPVFSKFLIFPDDEAFYRPVDVFMASSQAFNISADNFALPNESDLVAPFFSNKSHEGETIYCAACHGESNISIPAKITRLDERISDQQDNQTSIVECDTCHMQNPIQTLWHIRGVE